MGITNPAGTWTYDHLLELPDDGRRWEIIDSDLYELTDATWPHASAVMAFIRLLLPLVKGKGGTLLPGPLDVFFDTADPVEPDILVILPNSRARPVRHGVGGPPDLLIEVLSPSNRAHDQIRKRTLYARGGVREYWIIDPDAATMEIIDANGETVELVIAAADLQLTLRSPLLGALAANPDALFPADTED